ncbi:response regulator transcription factor [Ponticaulis profundi]|uniref:Response regulator transcription factor n=1 Tax=Ponticaulis profundi TaxID=2665222 RepID=A0ABW1SAY2_9PROT
MSARIAVIEDELEIRELIVEELEDEGYEVDTAANGREGLEMIQRFKPQLVLSDITMPELDGYGMLENLRNMKAFRSTPIVFLSALADRRHIIQGKKLGVDDYVTKPIDFEFLLATIEARLREVERMTIEKEEQMLKLYNSFMSRPEQERRVKPALIVAQEWLELDAIENALKKLGVPFVLHHRGSKLDSYLREKAYSSIFISQHTNDVSASDALKQSELFGSTNVPKYLVIEDSKAAQDMGHWSSFNQVISLDTAKEADVNEVIAAHV